MRQYTVTGMTCAACQSHVEKAVAKVPGVSSVAVALLTNSMAVNGTASDEEIIRAVENAGYGARLKGEEKKKSSASEKLAQEAEALADHETPKLKRRLIWSAVFLALLMYITMGHNMLGWPVPAFFDHNHLGLALTEMFLALIVMYVNKDFFLSGGKSLAHGAPNMDTLVALGSGVSFLWSLYVLYEMTYLLTQGTSNADLMGFYHDRLYFESAAMIPALITVGKTLESLSKGRTTDALKSLMRMAPKTAFIEKNGQEVSVAIDEVQPGDIFVVRPGETIPVDGVIIEGTTAADESALTGESVPVDKAEGDPVKAATINRSGFIRARATRVGEDTTFSQIIRMVSDAAATKAPIARIADAVSAVFVPAVIGVAVLVMIVWILLGAPVAKALEYAICVLVISCPCALVISIPLSFFAGIGGASKAGVLVKGSNYLETLSKVKTVVFDKTGTLTKGVFQVTAAHPQEMSEKELLHLAAHVERYSTHPIAASLRAAYPNESDSCRVEAAEEIAGEGIRAHVNGNVVCVGNSKMMEAVGAEWYDCHRHAAGTVIHVSINGKYAGHVIISDVVKETSKAAIAALKSVGVARTVMLTGDAKEVADAVAKELGIDQVRSELLPADKVQNVEELLLENKGNGNLAFVGDGINDAPVLTRADIGIAMGAMGSDAAIEAADVVLMDDDPMKISQAIRISRKCLAIVNQNTWFSIGIKLVVLLLGAVGIANMWFAIFADVGVMILAVLNAMRALFAGRTA